MMAFILNVYVISSSQKPHALRLMESKLNFQMVAIKTKSTTTKATTSYRFGSMIRVEKMFHVSESPQSGNDDLRVSVFFFQLDVMLIFSTPMSPFTSSNRPNKMLHI